MSNVPENDERWWWWNVPCGCLMFVVLMIVSRSVLPLIAEALR